MKKLKTVTPNGLSKKVELNLVLAKCIVYYQPPHCKWENTLKCANRLLTYIFATVSKRRAKLKVIL